MATLALQSGFPYLNITQNASTGLVINGTDADGLPTSHDDIDSIDLDEDKYHSQWSVDLATCIVTTVSAIGSTHITIAFQATCTDTGSRPAPAAGSGERRKELEFLTITVTITSVTGTQTDVTNNRLPAGP